MEKIPVGILGATGTVGQKLITLLENHPQFLIIELAASTKSSGRQYANACTWRQGVPISSSVSSIVVKHTNEVLQAPILFSGLDSSIAGEVETHYAEKGHVVISNSRNHRMDPDVPLVIPEVNYGHLALIHKQKTRGAIITNPNCSTMFLTMVLAPLYRSYGIEWVQVNTMQAISGAGYPGVASMDILGNIVPYISGEEEKLETEPLKILGTLQQNTVQNAAFPISASCSRVPVTDGHMEFITVKLATTASIQDIEHTLVSWKGLPQECSMYSAPQQPLIVHQDPYRPQPLLDLHIQKGMAAVIGRLRTDTMGNITMMVLGHNTIRGAAGAAVLNAETCLSLECLQPYL